MRRAELGGLQRSECFSKAEAQEPTQRNKEASSPAQASLGAGADRADLMTDPEWAATMERKWEELATTVVESIAVSSQRRMREEIAHEVQQQFLGEEGYLPPWLVQWHQTYIEDPELAEHEFQTMLVMAMFNEMVEKDYPADLRRLIWVVLAYRTGAIAPRYCVEGAATPPERPGMASANAIGTISSSWTIDDEGTLKPPIRNRGQGREVDPVAAGDVWLTRLRRRLAKLEGDGAELSTTERVMKNLLTYLPSRRGRPTLDRAR